MNTKQKSVPATQTQELPAEVFTEVFNEVEHRTGIFNQTKTIAVVSWFFNFILQHITSKCRATIVKDNPETTLTLQLKDVCIFIKISDKIDEKGGRYDHN